MTELSPLSSYRDARQLIKMAGSNPTKSELASKQDSRTPMSKKGRRLHWRIMISLKRLPDNKTTVA